MRILLNHSHGLNVKWVQRLQVKRPPLDNAFSIAQQLRRFEPLLERDVLALRHAHIARVVNEPIAIKWSVEILNLRRQMSQLLLLALVPLLVPRRQRPRGDANHQRHGLALKRHVLEKERIRIKRAHANKHLIISIKM